MNQSNTGMLLLLVVTSALTAMVSGQVDTVRWVNHRGSLAKPGYTSGAAHHSVASDAGSNRLTFTLRHLGTSRQLSTYSKWEVNRWGDPFAEAHQGGSWRVASNQANAVVLGLWGDWGWDGAALASRPQPGDTTRYELTIAFDQPVSDLTLPLCGINALFEAGRYNNADQLEIESFNGQRPGPTMTYHHMGNSILAQGASIEGDTSRPHHDPTSDDTAVTLRSDGPLDQLIIRFTNRALRTASGDFADGKQPWAFSLGDLSFATQPREESLQPTAIRWHQRQGTLFKEGYNPDTVTYQALSEDGLVDMTLSLEHNHTTPGLTTYSKWEIDRWGDPSGQHYAEGSWQVVTSAVNDVVLGLWGYWGGPGETVALGDTTSYRLVLTFNHPVSNLEFPLYGINGFLKPSAGFNSGDELSVQGALEHTPVAYTFAETGPAMTRVANGLVGNYAHQIDDGISGQHMSQDGAVRVHFQDPVDRVVLTLINRAGHLHPASFQNGLQTWSMSLGDLTFQHNAPHPTNLARIQGVHISQSSTLQPHTGAHLLMDGLANGNLWDRGVSHTSVETQPWITIDLGAIRSLDAIKLWHRTDTLAQMPDDLVLFLSSHPFTTTDVSLTATQSGVVTKRDLGLMGDATTIPLQVAARYIRLQREGTGALSFAEIELIGPSSPAVPVVVSTTTSDPSLQPNDPSPNPLLDQLGALALNTATFPAGLDIVPGQAGGFDLLFERALLGSDAVTHTIELSSNLVDWQPHAVAFGSHPLVHVIGIDQRIPALRERGFARLRITAGSEVTHTGAVGWYRTALREGYQTHGISLMRAPVAVGQIVAVADGGFVLEMETGAPIPHTSAYVEVVAGPLEGHRFDLKRAEIRNERWHIHTDLVHSTLPILNDDILGAPIVVRPHWTLSQAYTIPAMRPGREAALAGQVLCFREDHYESFYRVAAPTGPYWVRAGDDRLEDAGQRILRPGEGVFLALPPDVSGECAIAGHVRAHRFHQPLTAGHHLLAQPFPVTQSPFERELNRARGFEPALDPTQADVIQRWLGDLAPEVEAFDSYFYFRANPSTAYWVKEADTLLTPHSLAPLFVHDRAVFLQVREDRPDYHLNNLR